MTEQQDKRCGTCRFWQEREGKYGPETYCRLTGKERYKDDMPDCMGWKEMKDYRWISKKTGERLTWKDTLLAMCNNYGTFCGRWHNNEFWAKVKSKIPNMTEEQAQEEVLQIEEEADNSLALWKFCQ